jgi:hypothetical protein
MIIPDSLRGYGGSPMPLARVPSVGSKRQESNSHKLSGVLPHRHSIGCGQ